METRTFHTPEPVELEIQIPVGDIEVETVDGDESTIELDGSDRLIAQTRVELVGDRLVVELEGGKGPFGSTIAIGDFSIGRVPLRGRPPCPHASRAGPPPAS